MPLIRSSGPLWPGGPGMKLTWNRHGSGLAIFVVPRPRRRRLLGAMLQMLLVPLPIAGGDGAEAQDGAGRPSPSRTPDDWRGRGNWAAPA